MLRTLDLFSGVGGFSLGLERTGGFETVAACEIDPWKRAQYRARFPSIPVFRDIRKVTGDAFRRLGPIDCIAGSPPCQDASAANVKGLGIDGPETGLFREAVRLVRELRPRWVCFENVPRLRTRGYDRVALWLEEEGYAVWPLVVGAGDLGANHERKRVWIIAHAPDARPQHGELAREGAYSSREGLEGPGPRAGGPGAQEPEPAGFHGDGHAAGEQVGRAGQSRQDVFDHPWLRDLDRHVRVHDGISTRLAARLRHGYGDAVLVPLVTEIGRAIIEADMTC